MFLPGLNVKIAGLMIRPRVWLSLAVALDLDMRRATCIVAAASLFVTCSTVDGALARIVQPERRDRVASGPLLVPSRTAAPSRRSSFHGPCEVVDR